MDEYCLRVSFHSRCFPIALTRMSTPNLIGELQFDLLTPSAYEVDDSCTPYLRFRSPVVSSEFRCTFFVDALLLLLTFQVRILSLPPQCGRQSFCMTSFPASTVARCLDSRIFLSLHSHICPDPRQTQKDCPCPRFKWSTRFFGQREMALS